MMRRGFTLISAVIFIAITISVTSLVYVTAVPAVKKIQDAAIIENMKTAFVQLDKIIREVAAEGKGSKRTVSVNVQEGTLSVNATQNALAWKFDTNVDIISPRSSQSFGNVQVGSQLETSASEGSYGGVAAYILENEFLKVYIRKVGTPSSHTNYSTNQLLLGIDNKVLGQTLNTSNFFEITIDDDQTTKTGTGYTSIDAVGFNLPSATVTAFMNNSKLNYLVNLTLSSSTDFLEIKGFT